MQTSCQLCTRTPQSFSLSIIIFPSDVYLFTEQISSFLKIKTQNNEPCTYLSNTVEGNTLNLPTEERGWVNSVPNNGLLTLFAVAQCGCLCFSKLHLKALSDCTNCTHCVLMHHWGRCPVSVSPHWARVILFTRLKSRTFGNWFCQFTMKLFHYQLMHLFCYKLCRKALMSPDQSVFTGQEMHHTCEVCYHSNSSSPLSPLHLRRRKTRTGANSFKQLPVLQLNCGCDDLNVLIFVVVYRREWNEVS